jgi:hypothetical protein
MWENQMRKIIYMGEFDGRNYYYNTRTKEGLVALDSKTIKKKGERNEYLSTLIMMLFWLFLILEALMFLIPVFHGMHYPKLMITPFIMLSIVTPLLYILFMEECLYYNVNYTVLSTKEAFSQAVYTNKFWNNFFNKKSTLLKIPIFIFAMLVMLIFSTIYFGWGWLYSTNIIAEKAFDPGILIVIPIFTIFTGIPFLLFFQNNPVRWLLAVRKLERGKIIFEEENHV